MKGFLIKPLIFISDKNNRAEWNIFKLWHDLSISRFTANEKITLKKSSYCLYNNIIFIWLIFSKVPQHLEWKFLLMEKVGQHFFVFFIFYWKTNKGQWLKKHKLDESGRELLMSKYLNFHIFFRWIQYFLVRKLVNCSQNSEILCCSIFLALMYIN